MQIPERPPSRDHIKPRSKGHTLDEGNRALVCCRCNHDKGSLSLGHLRACHERGMLAPIMRAAFIERGTGLRLGLSAGRSLPWRDGRVRSPNGPQLGLVQHQG
jgi:HNH endonuclease